VPGGSQPPSPPVNKPPQPVNKPPGGNGGNTPPQRVPVNQRPGKNPTGESPKVAAPPPPVHAPAPARVQQAKTAPPVKVNVAKPPPPPQPVNFTERVNTVATVNNNVTVVNNNTYVRPNRWDYVGYEGRNPYFYNPYQGPVYVRYFYGGAYQTMYVPVGARMLMDVATAAAYPYTVLGDDFVASGYFNGDGYVPQTWENVDAYVPAYDQSVLVDRVTYVGHDDSKPVGQQDTFMLNDNTLAWGTKKDDGDITIDQTQPTPGVGPVDDGGSLVHQPVALAVKESGNDWQWWAGGAALATLTAAGVTTWAVRRRKVAAPVTGPIDFHHGQGW
jgi:hypothetical protein